MSQACVSKMAAKESVHALDRSGFDSKAFMDRYQEKFVEFVVAKKIARRLRIANVISEGLLHEIQSNGPEEAVAKLFLHLRKDANYDNIRKLYGILTATPGYPKMRKLGYDMKNDASDPLQKFNCEQFMDKYQKFIEVVAAKKIAKKLFIEHAIDQDLLHYIENSGPEEAVEELFLHLKYNADPDAIRKVCRIMVTTRCGSKMSELGELMMKDEDLPPAIDDEIIEEKQCQFCYIALLIVAIVLIFTAIIVIIAIIAIIAISVWIVLIQQGSLLSAITDSKMATVSEDCPPPYYGWPHKNDSCPANPGHSPNAKPEDGTDQCHQLRWTISSFYNFSWTKPRKKPLSIHSTHRSLHDFDRFKVPFMPVSLAEVNKEDLIFGKLNFKGKVPFDDILNGHGSGGVRKRVLLFGTPGNGKSTSLEQISHQFLRGKFGEEFTMIIGVQLSLLPENASDAKMEDLFYTVLDKNNTTEKETVVEFNASSCIGDGEGVLFLFDTYDGLPPSYLSENSENIVSRIIKVGDLMPKASFVITSRPSTAIVLVEHVDRCIVVLGFSGDEEASIRNFTKSFFNESYGDEVYRQLQSNSHLYALCHNPLYLRIVCFITYCDETLPNVMTATQLLDHFVCILVAKSNSSTCRCKPSVTDLIVMCDEFNKIANLSLYGVNSNMGSFTNSFLEKHPELKELIPDQFDPFELMYVIRKFGISEQVEVSYHYIHQIICEFLAACALANSSDGGQSEFWDRHLLLSYNGHGNFVLSEDRYKMVFTFYAGITKLQNRLIQDRMVQSMDPYFVKQVYFYLDTEMTKMCEVVHESQNKDLYKRIVSASDNVTSVHLMNSTFLGKRFPIHSITWCVSHHPVIQYLELTSIPPHEVVKLLRHLSHITSRLISFECFYVGTTTLEDEEIIRTFLSKCKLRHFRYHAYHKSEKEPHGAIGSNSMLRVGGMPLAQAWKKIADSNTHTGMPRKTDVEMVLDIFKSGILRLEVVLNTGDSKNLSLDIINDQSGHESLEDIALTGKCDYQKVIAMKLWTKQITLSDMTMSFETFLELIASFSHVERLSLFHVFFEPTPADVLSVVSEISKLFQQKQDLQELSAKKCPAGIVHGALTASLKIPLCLDLYLDLTHFDTEYGDTIWKDMLKALEHRSIRTLSFLNLFEPIPEPSLMEFISSLSASDLEELNVAIFANESFVTSKLLSSIKNTTLLCPSLDKLTMDVRPASLATALLAGMGAGNFSNLTKLDILCSISLGKYITVIGIAEWIARSSLMEIMLRLSFTSEENLINFLLTCFKSYKLAKLDLHISIMSNFETTVDDQYMRDLEIVLNKNNALKRLTLRSPQLSIPRTVLAIVNGASNSNSLKVLDFDMPLSFLPLKDLVERIQHLRVKKKMKIITSWS